MDGLSEMDKSAKIQTKRNGEIEYDKSTKDSEIVKFDEAGLIPVIAQDYKTNEVLMMAYMNEESYNKTLETGHMTYWSRSRQKLWAKGEESGHVQKMVSLTM